MTVADELPRQASLNRLRRFDIRPNRELGQNFLIDDNVLRVIEKEAALDPADVVLEVGGGLGVLSEHLAPRVGHLHVVEIDRSLEAALRDAVDPLPNATLHMADAVQMDLAALDPAPTKVVANLPYGVAATVLLRTVEELPGATLWLAMVQREVAERLAAAPGGKVYGATSVLAQVAGTVKVARRIPRVGLPPGAQRGLGAGVHRRAPARRPRPRCRRWCTPAFAHRRKTLAGSLALAPDAPDGIRAAAREALEGLGHPADARAERLTPTDFVRLAEALA